VLVNLLDNAYKYSHGDKRIELKVFSENNAVYFSVADNGIGMTGRQVKKIFDIFYQADSSLTRRKGSKSFKVKKVAQSFKKHCEKREQVLKRAEVVEPVLLDEAVIPIR